MGSLDNYPSRESLQHFAEPSKNNTKEVEKRDGKEELETSAATSKPGAKLEVSSVNRQHEQNSATVFTLRAKINELEQKLLHLETKLENCSEKLTQSVGCLEEERQKNKRLGLQNEELCELLTLEELRAQTANEHVTKMSRLFDELIKEDRGTFSQIQEKDEIIMLNEEL